MRGARPSTRASSPECRSRSTSSVRRPGLGEAGRQVGGDRRAAGPALGREDREHVRAAVVAVCEPAPGVSAPPGPWPRPCPATAGSAAGRGRRRRPAAAPPETSGSGCRSARATTPGADGSASAASTSAGRLSASWGSCHTSTSGTRVDDAHHARALEELGAGRASSLIRATRISSGCGGVIGSGRHRGGGGSRGVGRPRGAICGRTHVIANETVIMSSVLWSDWPRGGMVCG